MAWTKEEAEVAAQKQTEQFRARGCMNVRMVPRFFNEQVGWIVDGVYDMDVEQDPIWGPIVEDLKACGVE